jgi:serine/threonine protein kinase
MNDSLAKEETSLEGLLAEVTDEFLGRVKRGEEPSVEEYAARHPALAEVLRQMLPALTLMRSPASASGLGENGETPACIGAQTLGDFRLGREVGRGGMGVVYEAVQMSLGRRVALKVLPFASTLDPKQLQRFKNEAQSAAHLHHQHIVPVYATGCERGVHYYAMQFIDGQTLAEVIADLRSQGPDLKKESGDFVTTGPYHADRQTAVPDLKSAVTEPTVTALSTERSIRSPAYFRTVAQLGVHAAEALEHAHELGVVHRDIKPANLLVDGRGQLWVTDFGLAHCHSQAGLTMSGDLLGTLRYMSPEQALAQRVLIDHRTDVYSLGVTLYELLTLEPAFAGNDRQELLQQIAFEEPRPPRRINKAIPVELETIVLKAMEKNPAERYSTAQELVEDLQRYLKDEPIRARRQTVVHRLKRWLRRHQRVLRAAAIGLALAMAGLAVSTVLVWQQKVQRENALKDSVAALAKAEAALTEADIQRRQARQAVEDMYTQVAQEWLADQPHMTDMQRQFLLKALHYFEEFAKEKSPDPAVRQQKASAYGRVGQIQFSLGHHDEALAATHQAIALFEQLVTDLSQVADYQEGLAKGCNDLGEALRYTGAKQDAEIALRRAVDLQEKLTVEYPTVLGYRDALAAYYLNLAVTLMESNRPQRAEETYQKALKLRQELAREHPNIVGYQNGLANVSFNLGSLLDDSGRSSEAAQLWAQAAATWKRLAEEYPHVPRFRDRLARTYISLSNLREFTQPDQSLADARQAQVLLERLTADFPRLPVYRKHLAITLSNLGNRQKSKGRLTEAESLYWQAISHLRKLADEFPNVPGHQFSLGLSLHNLAVLLRDQGKLEEAQHIARQAIGCELTAVKVDSKQRDYSVGLANGYVNLTEILLRLGNHKEAGQLALKAPQLFPEEPLVAADAARLLTRCVRLAEQDRKFTEGDRRQAAQAYGNHAVELLGSAIRNRLPNAGSLKKDPAFDSLRSRDDFKKLAAGVDESPKQR